jgi:hypothetical protein
MEIAVAMVMLLGAHLIYVPMPDMATCRTAAETARYELGIDSVTCFTPVHLGPPRFNEAHGQPSEHGAVLIGRPFLLARQHHRLKPDAFVAAGLKFFLHGFAHNTWIFLGSVADGAGLQGPIKVVSCDFDFRSLSSANRHCAMALPNYNLTLPGFYPAGRWCREVIDGTSSRNDDATGHVLDPCPDA